MWLDSVFVLSQATAEHRKSKAVFKYAIEPDAAKGSAVTKCKLVKSSLQDRGRQLFFVCGADLVLIVSKAAIPYMAYY
jgi:hypothetical protein